MIILLIYDVRIKLRNCFIPGVDQCYQLSANDNKTLILNHSYTVK